MTLVVESCVATDSRTLCTSDAIGKHVRARIFFVDSSYDFINNPLFGGTRFPSFSSDIDGCFTLSGEDLKIVGTAFGKAFDV